MEFILLALAAAVLWKPAYALVQIVTGRDKDGAKARLSDWWVRLKALVLPTRNSDT